MPLPAQYQVQRPYSFEEFQRTARRGIQGGSAFPFLKLAALATVRARCAKHSGSGKRLRRRLPNRKGRSWAWRICGYCCCCRCLWIAESRAWRAGCVAMPELAVQKVVVHPLVLLSVVDHFNR